MDALVNALEHGWHCGLGMDALVNALEPGCYCGSGMDARMDIIMVWAWMLW